MTIFEKYSVGEVRPSQLLHTFGVGAVIDLPHLSVMIMGLDDWDTRRAQEIGEDRLLTAVQRELGQQVERLLGPPRDTTPPTANPFAQPPQVGVPVATFPRWLLCPYCRLLAPLDSGLVQLKTDLARPERTRYIHSNCARPGAPPAVLPARFLVACEHGHLDDFPWRFFVHRGAQACNGPLRLKELGASGEAAEIDVECAGCGARRRMSDAFGEEAQQNLPACRGRRPHLRDFAETGCAQPLKTILLGASNSWFGITLTALSVPVAVDRLGQLVEAHWHVLDKLVNQQNVELLMQLGNLPQLIDYGAGDVWAAIERKRSGAGPASEPRALKAPEWQVLTAPQAAPSLPHFQVVEVPPPSAYAGVIERVVLVERLREVSALLGFTRIASPGDFEEALELPEQTRAPLARKAPTWVPATEVHGEGLFLQFREDAIMEWLRARPALAERDRAFAQAHRQWRRRRRLDPTVPYPGLRYVLLHSLSHALIRQLALECGYTLASIRERIYALPPTAEDGPMAGLLLYTAAPDSEGTLGGLVSLGSPGELGRHLDAALSAMRLCTSDPLCAEHTPLLDAQVVQGAACHACLHAPETSCERGNKFLDRTLLVPTLDTGALAFFPGIA
ncbi:MAG TPA: DUF1998 domain-containing protein [Herpetosiphonaceae bacterium]